MRKWIQNFWKYWEKVCFEIMQPSQVIRIKQRTDPNADVGAPLTPALAEGCLNVSVTL